MTHPSLDDVREAVQVLRMCIIPLEPDNKSVRALIALAESYLEVSGELPEDKTCGDKNIEACIECSFCEVRAFNSALSLCRLAYLKQAKK